ncbi:MAG: deoxyribonuclease IV [Gemmatimonadota bacterium]
MARGGAAEKEKTAAREVGQGDTGRDDAAPIARDELGAHVSSAGGADNAPARANDVHAVNFQLFTKQPSRWAEPEVSEALGARFIEARREHDIVFAGAHDSYLINLASPDDALRARSLDCFQGELRRCRALELDFLVTHPGNATDGDLASGLARNAEAVAAALEAVAGPTRVLLEITAGSGTTVGATLENLATVIDGIPEPMKSRVGVCFDTCHAYAAGYDLVRDYDGVWDRFDAVLGMERLGLFHLNDSKHPFDSRKDRHEQIGRGSLGEEPFRRIMTDRRFAAVPKLLETPKGDDLVTNDRENLALLRSFRTS